LEREQSFWRQEDIPIFGCVDLQAAFEGQAPTAAVPSGLVGVWLVEQPVRSRTHIRRLERAAADCHTIAKARTAYREALAAFAKGELGARVAELRRSEEALLQEQKRLSEKQGDYAKALAVYKNELAEQKQGKSSAEKVRDLAAKVEKAIDAIEDVQGFLNAKFLSEERIKRIDDLLGKLKTGKEPAEDASKVEVSIFYLPLLADDIRAIEAAEQGRSAVPLLIKRDIEQARLNGAKSVVAAKELGIELRRAAIESRLGEIQSIVDARQTFLVAPKSDSAPLGLQSLTRPFFSAWDELAERQKFALLQSVSMYLDSIGRQRAMTEKLDRTRLALASEEASSLSEVNASMWTSLIGAGVAQAAEYSALGLKASDFQGILSTLGILWIGYGTNR
jgi:tetratricopeptide (TPR) repeat protein